jgi:dihydroneopterin aldolase
MLYSRRYADTPTRRHPAPFWLRLRRAMESVADSVSEKVADSGQWIAIVDLEVQSRIGVPEQEREKPQTLLVSIRFQIGPAFGALNDRFDQTVDYSAVAAEVEKIVQASSAHLVETLVSDIGNSLMRRFPIQRLEIELKKFILRNARYVSVKADWAR